MDLENVCEAVWKSDSVPDDWMKGVIVLLYTDKENKTNYFKNYRGINLLSIIHKVYSMNVIVLKELLNPWQVKKRRVLKRDRLSRVDFCNKAGTEESFRKKRVERI